MISIADLDPSLKALLGDALDCLADDGEIDEGLYLHIQMYVFEEGIETPESPEWVQAAVTANPGIWTARLCRAMHNKTETKAHIAHCGLCREYSNQRKRHRAKILPPNTLPGFDEIGGAFQLHDPCGICGLTWLRKLVYRLRAQGWIITHREPIPDSRQPRGWDYATRIYPSTEHKGGQ